MLPDDVPGHAGIRAMADAVSGGPPREAAIHIDAEFPGRRYETRKRDSVLISKVRAVFGIVVRLEDQRARALCSATFAIRRHLLRIW